MKTLIHHIQEKLKIGKNTAYQDHICNVVFGEFIAWLYGWPYYNILDLASYDLKPELIFSPIRKEYFDNSVEKLYDFFCKYATETVEIESIEKYQGSWVYTFTLDNIYFETESTYKDPLDVRKKKNPHNRQLRFIKESQIDEKLKISKNNNRQNENFCEVILGRLVAYMLGYATKSIEQLKPTDLSSSEAGFVITAVKRHFNGSYKKLYDFLVDHKDDIVELECNKTQDWWTYIFEVDDKLFVDMGWEDSLIGLKNNKKNLWSKYIDFII